MAGMGKTSSARTRPRIRSRNTTTLSPWVRIVAREVEFSPAEPAQLYHAIEQADYIAMVALTPAGQIPIVRQYRPALEEFSWELPAGLLEDGEDPAETCRRELFEETGFHARVVHRLGETAPCTGRLSNRMHSFFVETGEQAAKFRPEPGVAMKLVTPAQLARMIKNGEFVSQLHIATLLLAELHGILTLPRPAARPTGRPDRPPSAPRRSPSRARA
jgi:ADP-ribose pyrophosphatase